jgi:pilus assembly protein Flp/PilA
MQILVSFFRDDFGATAIEYALVCGLISAACIGAISTVGNSVSAIYTAIQTALGAAL